MNTATLLHQMCHDCLSQADFNALRRNRGFAKEEISSRTHLENFYLSPAGVEQALARLTTGEIAILHLLHLLDKPVTVDVFERLYNPDFQPGYSSPTFTQRYRPVFKQVRKKLVRRGVLIMGEANLADSTKMEQWRFRFPAEFAPFLPRPLAEIERRETPGTVRRDVPRSKLLALVGEAEPPSPRLRTYELTLTDGRLHLGQRPFRAAALDEWQKAAWETAMPDGTRRNGIRRYEQEKDTLPVLEALTYALGLLRPGEWVAPAQLDTVLRMFTGRTFDVEAVCRLGWEWGYLAQNTDGARAVYRLAAPETTEEEEAPAGYLTRLDDSTARIDLHTVPYPSLEQLNQVVSLSLRDGQLVATPDLIRMGNARPGLLSAPPVQWLADHVPAFAATRKTVQERWGKQILHTNLYVARVKDLALRVRLERGLKEHQLITLSDEYVAFPARALSDVKRIVTQAGHVIKHHDA